MDYRQLFADDDVGQEFLDRFDEIAASAEGLGGLEGMGSGLTVDRAADAVRQMTEGVWVPGDSGIEAIIERHLRPVHLVQKSTPVLPPDGFITHQQVTERVERSRRTLEKVIPSVGRIDLRNHLLEYAGTGWMVGPRLVVTNRHVAQEFAYAHGKGFAFETSGSGKPVRATLDWYQEYQQPQESRFRVTEVVWIEPRTGPDVALLRISPTGEDGESAPAVISLDISRVRVGQWIGVIGYPAFDSRANRPDQQRIFDNVYDCKRLAAGLVTAVDGRGTVHHDATTLGGNSGSAVVDLDTGHALALHFRGKERRSNEAVPASAVARIVEAHGH
ncbi:trypsin-like serine peptidase [Streptomyces europaeiscabiei]|uniref:trypsin-like serine peptidase n=1 Tax=Streptomyces europaeiscabiei TaxID=146819 RepID=UPI0029B66F69|nr:serine protease [Streptomyces europaeiscabiei]MDX3585740.1 serine protease [Streptomyces europaeiscabiei]MDX3635982.1 serine protease [Streptomyces europaeiscabiei]MDX3654058.1 serine protease [Streptomyces europaeiscabiei]